MPAYYAILARGPHDVSVRLSAARLTDAIDEVARLNADAMIGTDRRDLEYYAGVGLASVPVDQRETALAGVGLYLIGDVIARDDATWSLFSG